MMIEEFLRTTAERIPTVDEMAGLCDSLGIRFFIKDDRPFMKAAADVAPEAEAMAKLLKREPFRSAMISRKLGGSPVSPPVEEVATDEECQIEVPDDATIVIVDADGRGSNDSRFSGAHMWCWTGAAKWFYVKDHPVPNRK